MADAEKPDLMGPVATGHWLEILRRDELPQREYLTLTDAATQLGYAPEHLLCEGIAGNLNLYAPVLHEGLYVWPVNERGISHTRLLGDISNVKSVFQARFQYGELMALSAMDIKKIKIEKSIRPNGYLYPELVLLRISEQENELKTEHVTDFSKRMTSLATQIAWIPAYPEEAGSSKIDADMLHVDINDLPRLKAQCPKIDDTDLLFKTIQKNSSEFPIKIEETQNTYNTSIQVNTTVVQVSANHLTALTEQRPRLSTPDQSQSPQGIDENTGACESNSSSEKSDPEFQSVEISSPSKDITQNNTGKPGKRPAIEDEIVRAQAEAKESGLDPNSANDIWGILTKRAEEKSPRYPRLKG